MTAATLQYLEASLQLALASLSDAQKDLLFFGVLMALSMLPTYLWSQLDSRTIRDVGIWVKPMKFMASTALFAVSTVWLTTISGTAVGSSETFKSIAALIIGTSLFEVGYITFQASLGSQSHYNTSDPLHALLFGLMAIAAVGLTASQTWLAWIIWIEKGTSALSVTTFSVIVGLVLTFVLSTASGFLLGGNQPPPGTGLPVVGWHLFKDLRPAHFLGVHAQQFIPIAGIIAERTLGNSAFTGFSVFSALYFLVWCGMMWIGITSH